MRVFKSKTFNRWAVAQDIRDIDLCRAVREMKTGLIDAFLGGGIVKKRVRGFGRGKRGGYRTVIATNLRERWVFVFGFSKNARTNISQTELRILKVVAANMLSMSTLQISTALQTQQLVEIDCGEAETAH